MGWKAKQNLAWSLETLQVTRNSWIVIQWCYISLWRISFPTVDGYRTERWDEVGLHLKTGVSKLSLPTLTNSFRVRVSWVAPVTIQTTSLELDLSGAYFCSRIQLFKTISPYIFYIICSDRRQEQILAYA